MANGSNPAARALDLTSAFFAASARRGGLLLAVGIFGGVVFPPLARALHFFVAPNVVMLMTLVLLRVDISASMIHLRRPGRLAAIIAFQLIGCPIIAWLAIRPLGLDQGVADGIVIFATGCAATSSPAFARLVGLDPDLTLLATLATTLLVPFTAPPMAFSLMGLDLAIGMANFFGRLMIIVGLPLAFSFLLRRIIGPARLAPYGGAVDGLVVWLVVFYGFGVMQGLGERIAADPAWVVQATLAAFGVDFGLNIVTTLAFIGLGRRAAASAGLMSGNRNMALYLAVLPAAADPRIGLFFALCQFPLFLSPFLLRPVYRLILPRAPPRLSA